MDNQEELYERIEQYLSGSMSPEQQQNFERDIQSNPALAQEVELHRQLQGAIQQEAGDVMTAQAIQRAASDYFSDQLQEGKIIQMPRSSANWYWLAASIALILLVGIGFYFVSTSATSNKGLVASNFTVYEAPALFRSDDKEGSPTLKAAYTAYNQKDYRQAEDLFSKSLGENPRQIVPNFYIGQCRLALNDPNGAVLPLQKVISHGDNAYVTQAKWYLALAYLGGDHREQAVPLLQELSQQSGAFSKQAEELLQDLADLK